MSAIFVGLFQNFFTKIVMTNLISKNLTWTAALSEEVSVFKFMHILTTFIHIIPPVLHVTGLSLLNASKFMKLDHLAVIPNHIILLYGFDGYNVMEVTRMILGVLLIRVEGGGGARAAPSAKNFRF